MKRLIGIGLVAVMAMVGASTAQALSIGINLSSGDSASTVSSLLSGGSVAQANWNNWNMDGGSFVGGVVDSSGAAVSSGLSLGLDLAWGGGWSYYWAVENGNGAANSLAYSTWTAAYGPIVHIANIPYATYDVAVFNGGWGGSEMGWSVETGLSGSSYTTPSYRNGGGVFAAIQIINTAVVVDPPPVVPEPGTIVLLGSLLGLGAIGGLRRRFFGAKKSVVA